MKKAAIITATAIILLNLCNSCKTPRYIPIQTTKKDHRENTVIDTIFCYDSVFVKEQGDTFILERYKYLYKTKIVHDSILVSDTIRVPCPVEVIKQVREPLSSLQNFQIWSGRIALAVFFLVIIHFISSRRK